MCVRNKFRLRLMPRVRELQIRSSITTMALAQLRKTATPISSICGIASLRLTRVKRIESLAYDFTTKKTMGAHWHPSDKGQYPCTSNAIQHGHKYNAAGRGNTNYASKYGLNTITLTGTCYSDLD